MNFTMIRGGLFADVPDFMRKADSISPGKMLASSLAATMFLCWLAGIVGTVSVFNFSSCVFWATVFLTA